MCGGTFVSLQILLWAYISARSPRPRAVFRGPDDPVASHFLHTCCLYYHYLARGYFYCVVLHVVSAEKICVSTWRGVSPAATSAPPGAGPQTSHLWLSAVLAGGPVSISRRWFSKMTFQDGLREKTSGLKSRELKSLVLSLHPSGGYTLVVSWVSQGCWTSWPLKLHYSMIVFHTANH